MKRDIYPPIGRFVINQDEQGNSIRVAYWQLDCWLVRYTDYLSMPPNLWLKIQGGGLCLFQAYDYAKYLEKTSIPEQTKFQFESQRRDESIATETGTFIAELQSPSSGTPLFT